MKNRNVTKRTKKIEGAWIVRQSELKIEIVNVAKTMAFLYYAGSAQYAQWNMLLESDNTDAMKNILTALACTVNLYYSKEVFNKWIDTNRKHIDSIKPKEISEEEDQEIIEELKMEEDGKDTLEENN